MRTDIYGQIILNENDLCELYLCDPNRVIKTAYTDTKIKLNEDINIDLFEYVDPKLSVEEFDELQQNMWYLPKEYLDMDIAKWILDQCANETELQRAGEELLLFQDRGMFTLLKYLKYLVDTMRANNIVWGVGRGSSVASFILFLIGIHRINSLYYDLSIDEFLK